MVVCLLTLSLKKVKTNSDKMLWKWRGKKWRKNEINIQNT